MTRHSRRVNVPSTPGPVTQSSPALDKTREATEPITVAVVEDNPGLRRSFERLLRRAAGVRCVGSWPDGESALKQVADLQPNVVLMDINLPGMSGIECTATLRRLCPRSHVIIVTVYEDTDTIFHALKAGACGYLLKRASSPEILDAIVDVCHGGAPMTSEIARRVVEAFQSPLPNDSGLSSLSSREQEILKLLSQGFSNKEIANALNIAYQTVKVHFKRIYEKLHVRSRTEAVLKFMGERGAPAARTPASPDVKGPASR